MADLKISDLSAAAPVSSDYVEILDVSDVTMGPAGSNKRVLVSDLVAIAGGAPFADTTAIAKGSADATKLLRFEVDGFTTGTTRVLTPPNADAIIAGTNFANTFTAQQVFDTGAAGGAAVSVRKTGGSPGTNETLIYHDGTAVYDNKTGVSNFLTNGSKQYIGMSGAITVAIDPNNKNTDINCPPAGRLGFCNGDPSGTAPTAAICRPANGVLSITNGSTGGGSIEFVQVADVPTPQTNSAGIGAEDVAGTAELIGTDEAGNETQLTPHAADAPAALYDGTHAEEVHRTINRYLNRVEFVNLTRLARLVEQIAAGSLAAVQALPAAKRRLHVVETLADYATRTGRVKSSQTWQQVQNAHQARYDAERAQELARHAAGLLKPEAERGPVPPVRPIKDIRKPLPQWLADRGAV